MYIYFALSERDLKDAQDAQSKYNAEGLVELAKKYPARVKDIIRMARQNPDKGKAFYDEYVKAHGWEETPLSDKELKEVEKVAQETGILPLRGEVEKYPEHAKEICETAKRLGSMKNKEMALTQLRLWNQRQEWAKEANTETGTEAGAEAKSEPMSQQFPNLTVKQANAAMAKPDNPGDPTVAKVANKYPEYADKIIEHATAAMKADELESFAKETIKADGKDPNAVQADEKDSSKEDTNQTVREDGKVEDRTKSEEATVETKYPVDEKINAYIEYLTNSFIESLCNIARGGDGKSNENATAYKAAKNRYKAFYDYARAHSIDKKTLKVEDYEKQFKVPDKFEPDLNMPSKVKEMMDVYRKCQNYDFRFTVNTGDYRFTTEYNRLYTLFYCLFLACFVIKDNPDNINRMMKFGQIGTKSMQSLYNECRELLNKIHNKAFGKDSELKPLNIEGQSNKDKTPEQGNTIEPEKEAKAIVKGMDADDSAMEASSAKSTEAAEEAIEKAAAEGDLRGEVKDTAGMDLSWYPPIQEKYLAFYEKHSHALSDVKGLEDAKDDFESCKSILRLNKLFKNDVNVIKDTNVFSDALRMYNELFRNPKQFNENSYLQWVPQKTDVFTRDTKLRERLAQDRSSRGNRRDAINLIKDVLEYVNNLEVIKKLKNKEKEDKQRQKEENLVKAKENRDKAKTAYKQAKSDYRAARKAFSSIYNFADVTRVDFSVNIAKIAEAVYCDTIFVIRYFGYNEDSIIKSDKEIDDKNNWLKRLQSKYKPADNSSVLSKAMFVDNISIQMNNPVFKNPDEKNIKPTYTDPIAQDFIVAAYKSMLQVDTSIEFLAAIKALLPDYLQGYLKRICYLMDRRPKSETNFNPSRGLRVLRNGLSDLFENDTLKNDKELNNMIPDGEFDLARDADALYRLLAQGKDVDWENKKSSNHLLSGIFEKYLVYQFGNFEKKTRELKTLTGMR